MNLEALHGYGAGLYKKGSKIAYENVGLPVANFPSKGWSFSPTSGLYKACPTLTGVALGYTTSGANAVKVHNLSGDTATLAYSLSNYYPEGLSIDNDNNLYMATSAGRVFKVGPTGIVIWQKTLGVSTYDIDCIKVAADCFYIGFYRSSSNRVIEQYSLDGTFQASYMVPSDQVPYAIEVAGDFVFLGTNNKVYKFDKNLTTVLGTYTLTDYITSYGLVYNKKDGYLYGTQRNGVLFVLDLNLVQIKRITLSYTGVSQPVLDSYGDIYFVFSNSSTSRFGYVKYSRKTHTVVWEYSSSTSYGVSACAYTQDTLIHHFISGADIIGSKTTLTTVLG